MTFVSFDRSTTGPSGVSILERLREHPDAPRWNHVAGDRLTPEDLSALDQFREALATQRGPRASVAPPPAVQHRLASLREQVPFFRKQLAHIADLDAEWSEIPTMAREDIALSASELVPDDADLDRLIVYRTAGTTGHALLVPHDPLAAGAYQPLIEHALSRHGVSVEFDAQAVACFLVGAQARTVTYPTTLSAWNGAGFAKLNLRPGEWPREGSARRYFEDLAPRVLTGDPISFSEMMRLEIGARPRALISTAVAMSTALRRKLSSAYGCPVIDWYSLTETGPIGYLCPESEAYHVLPHDIHVEVVNAEGAVASPGARGEIVVSGGRNPFLPLLRYRTGDFGALDLSACTCGDPMPRIRDLEGRAPVLFRAADGSIVNPVDLSRILREFPFVQHELQQNADGSCDLSARPASGTSPDVARVTSALSGVLGGVTVRVRFDARLGERAEGKVVPYRSALLLED